MSDMGIFRQLTKGLAIPDLTLRILDRVYHSLPFLSKLPRVRYGHEDLSVFWKRH
jgi:hypothetical protein